MYLGIEIGGTKLQLGVGRDDGRLRGLWRAAVDVTAGGEGIRRQIAAGVPALLAQAGIARAALRGIGVGFGGPVDDATQTVIKSHQIEGWDQFPLAQWLTEQWQLPTALGNDADVAGLGEACHGAGQGLSPLFYVTIGSGIGGGLLIDGRIYRGVGRGAAEIGHLRLRDGIILEHLASGWGLEKQYARRTGQHCSAVEIARLADQGDAAALATLHEAWSDLADGLAQVVALLCPRRIILGGGVALMGEKLLFAPLRKLLADRVFAPFAACYDVVPAQLGEEAVVHGALALAAQKFVSAHPDKEEI